MPPHVRSATVDDLPAVLDLYEQLYPEQRGRAGSRTDHAWAMTLATPQRTVLVAEVDTVRTSSWTGLTTGAASAQR
jgi:hypothetical protein